MQSAAVLLMMNMFLSSLYGVIQRDNLAGQKLESDKLKVQRCYSIKTNGETIWQARF